MKVLAIDPGFERVGVAILEKENGKEKLVFSCCIKTEPRDPFSKRLCDIGYEIRGIIKKYKPDALAIETLVFNTNQKTAMRVAEARGVALYESSLNNLSVYEYTPLQVKIAITGYGRATKEQVIAMVKKLIAVQNKAQKLDDEYDAIAIGLTHCAHAVYQQKTI